MTAASLADWFAFLSLGISVHAGFSVFYFLLVDADSVTELNPWPVLRHACEDGRLVPLWQTAVHVGHGLNRAYASGLYLARPAVDYVQFTARDVLYALPAATPEVLR